MHRLFDTMANMRIVVNESVKSEVAKFQKTIDEKLEKFDEKLEKFNEVCLQSKEMCKRIEPLELKQLEMDIDIESLKRSVDNMKIATEKSGENKEESYYNVVIKNFEYREEEALDENALIDDVTELIQEGLKLENVPISRVTRMHPIPTKNGTKAGHVVLSLKSKEDQSAVLVSKSQLRSQAKYRNVWIEMQKTRDVVAMERNCRMLLREMGKEKDYIFKGSRLVKKGTSGQGRTGDRVDTDSEAASNGSE
jgi:hypothetical protein